MERQEVKRFGTSENRN